MFLQKMHLSLILGKICDSLSCVFKILLRHLNKNSLKLLSRKERFHDDRKFFTISSGCGFVSVIAAKLLTTVRSRTEFLC
jgi:hypothetical protein